MVGCCESWAMPRVRGAPVACAPLPRSTRACRRPTRALRFGLCSLSGERRCQPQRFCASATRRPRRTQCRTAPCRARGLPETLGSLGNSDEPPNFLAGGSRRVDDERIGGHRRVKCQPEGVHANVCALIVRCGDRPSAEDSSRTILEQVVSVVSTVISVINGNPAKCFLRCRSLVSMPPRRDL